MKIWVPRQNEVQVTLIEKDNPDTDLHAGDLAVTMDGRTRFYTPDEFAERFEEKKIHEWPGYINVQSPDGRYDSGCIMVALEAHSAPELAEKLNTWAEAPENRGYIVKHLQTGADPNGHNAEPFYVLFMATTETSKEDREHLADVHNEVTKLLEERRAKKATEEANHLAKARELQAAAKAVEKAERRELERLAEAGRKHEANCGKKGKK